MSRFIVLTHMLLLSACFPLFALIEILPQVYPLSVPARAVVCPLCVSCHPRRCVSYGPIRRQRMVGSGVMFFFRRLSERSSRSCQRIRKPLSKYPQRIASVYSSGTVQRGTYYNVFWLQPDHFWDAKGHDHHPSDPSPRRGRGSHKSRTASHAANNTGTKSTSPPSCKASDHRSPSTRSRSPTRLISRSSSEVVPAVPSSASPPLSPLAVNPQNESSAEADLTAIQAKMEEYGKEIERLRGLLENSAKIESR